MEFKLIFTTGSNDYVLDQKYTTIGLSDLDQARTELNCNFDASLIKGTVDLFNVKEFNILLTEEQARKTDLFLHRSVETVIITNNLNKFAKRFLSVSRDPKTDAIISVVFKNKVDCNEVFNTWLADGCPLEWNP